MSAITHQSGVVLCDPPSVIVTDAQVVFRNFVETDQGVIELLSDDHEPDIAAHRLLALGARAAGYVATTTYAEALQSRLESMTNAVETSVSGTLDELSQVTRALLDSEDGELVALLTHFGTELGGMLDPARRDSAGAELAKALRSVMENTLEAHARQVRQLVDPEFPESPIGRVVGLVRDHNNILGDEVRRLAEVVVIDRARAEGLDHSGAKGIPYEEALFNVVAEVAAVSGDAAEHVGRDTGAAGNQKGDIVVHLSPTDTAGRSLCYALEAKTGKTRLRPLLAELDDVLANREAAAAIAVFGDPLLAPTKMPFQPYDNRALVILDRDEFDDRALRLACLWARWVARRQISEDATGVDLEQVAAAIDRTRRALGRAAAIRRAHSTANKAIGDARGQLDELVAEIDAALRSLTVELDRETIRERA